MSLRSSKELTPEQRRERRKLLASSGEARLEYIKGVTTDSEFQQAKTLPPSLPDKPVPAKPQPGDFSQLPTLLMQAAKNNSRLWKTLHRWLLITITVLLFFTITPLRTASIFNLCSIWLGVELFVGALFATIRQLLPSGEPDEKNKSVQVRRITF